jgi:hypothetical protein
MNDSRFNRSSTHAASRCHCDAPLIRRDAFAATRRALHWR